MKVHTIQTTKEFSAFFTSYKYPDCIMLSVLLLLFFFFSSLVLLTCYCSPFCVFRVAIMSVSQPFGLDGPFGSSNATCPPR